jgi:4-azaleucine resistance transporter AzlC
MVGYFPVGIAYGILMANLGYNFLWSALSSLVVYAGSLQMLMVSFLMNNVPIITILVTSLLLNSRHIFYGISFVDKFKDYGFWKAFLIYGMSDENYSLLCSYEAQEGMDEKWVHIFSAGLIWFYWAVFSGLGGLIGGLIIFNTTGIDFALTALFVVILIEQIKGAVSRLPVVIGSLSSVLWLLAVGPDRFLLPSLLSTVAVLICFKKQISNSGEVA